MDIETLNYLGYGEVFEISLWIALMYIGKGLIDLIFNMILICNNVYKLSVLL